MTVILRMLNQKMLLLVWLLCWTGLAFPEKYTIVLIPDTQFPIQDNPQLTYTQLTWVANHKDSLNIKYVLHEGDITNNGADTAQFTRGSAAIKIIEDAGLPWIMTPGNHDFNGTSLTNYNATFPVSRVQAALQKVSSYAQWGGSYPTGQNSNSYHLFSAGGVNWAILELQYNAGADTGIMSWANAVITQYSDRKFIVLTHSYLNNATTLTAQGTLIWNNLINKYKNIMCIFCGHIIGEATWLRTNSQGTLVYQMLNDFQNDSATSFQNSRTRFLEFDTQSKTIAAWEYSPPDNKMYTGATSRFIWTNIDFGTVTATVPMISRTNRIMTATLTGIHKIGLFSLDGRLVREFMAEVDKDQISEYVKKSGVHGIVIAAIIGAEGIITKKMLVTPN